MSAEVHQRANIFDGAVKFIAPALVCGFAATLFFYDHITPWFSHWDISVDSLYNYIFNLFAIEFGALVSLFALFACRPTPFLERIKNTHLFHAITVTVKVSLVATATLVLFTAILAIFKVYPDLALTRSSVIFVAWVWFSVGVTQHYAKTVTVIFSSLT